jgi:hypothetical protein
MHGLADKKQADRIRVEDANWLKMWDKLVSAGLGLKEELVESASADWNDWQKELEGAPVTLYRTQAGLVSADRLKFPGEVRVEVGAQQSPSEPDDLRLPASADWPPLPEELQVEFRAQQSPSGLDDLRLRASRVALGVGRSWIGFIPTRIRKILEPSLAVRAQDFYVELVSAGNVGEQNRLIRGFRKVCVAEVLRSTWNAFLGPLCDGMHWVGDRLLGK